MRSGGIASLQSQPGHPSNDAVCCGSQIVAVDGRRQVLQLHCPCMQLHGVTGMAMQHGGGVQTSWNILSYAKREATIVDA